MEKPLEITFRGLAPSPAIEANVRERAAKLERFFTDILSMQVVIEAPGIRVDTQNLLQAQQA